MAATLAQVRARSALRANMDDDATNSRVLTSDWNALINESYLELWAIVESSAGDRALSSFNFTLANGSITGGMTVNLPSDCDQVRAVTWNPDTDQAYDLDRFEWSERTNYPANRGLCYCPIGGILHIYPATRAGGPYRLDYVPAVVPLVLDADTVSTVVDKWNEYLVIATAIKARDVEESDTTVLEQQRQRLEKRIRSEGRRLDANRPKKVADVTTSRWPARLPPP